MTLDGSQMPQMNFDAKCVVLSAGGTGGHMFPALSVARALQARGVRVEMITDVRGARYGAQYPDIKMHVVRAETLRAGLVAKFKLVFGLSVGLGQALMLLRRLKPCAVVGFGGYPSVPGVLAAQALGIATILHEQNAVMGLANKLMAGGAKKIALSLPNVEAVPEKWRGKLLVSGNPVRADIEAIGDVPYEAAPGQGDFNLLVLGGSQGASVFSQLLPEAIKILPDAARGRLNIVQQCREADLAAVRAQYEEMGVRARLDVFISDVPARLKEAHLLIARSGASTVGEASAAARPAIFVPYPHHKDQQQKANANVLVRAGGAIMLEEKDIDAKKLAQALENVMNNPEDAAKMAAASHEALVHQADLRLADAILGS